MHVPHAHAQTRETYNRVCVCLNACVCVGVHALCVQIIYGSILRHRIYGFLQKILDISDRKENYGFKVLIHILLKVTQVVIIITFFSRKSGFLIQ